MTMDRAFALLTRENPTREEDLPSAHDLHGSALRERILLEPKRERSRHAPRRSRVSMAAVAGGVAALVAALMTVAPLGGDRAVENAAAAVKQAGALTADSARRSGTVVVRITHDGELWAGSTIRWNGRDLALRSDTPGRQGRPGSIFLVVDGMMYGIEDGAWVELGPPESVDPDSGTTPGEYLAAVRQDVGGRTLERITGAMSDLTTKQLEDGSTVYSGSVEAGQIAREASFKGDEPIRVLPFGYVAHDEASRPDALLDTAVTVGAEGVVRRISVSWGTWVYEVAYSELGTTPAPGAPADAEPLRRAVRD
jgi:hypothetical protein